MSEHLRYYQTSGILEIVHGDDCSVIGRGWAGCGEGKNNHFMEAVRCVGPLPCGWYGISAPFDHPKVGRYSLRLTPDPSNVMHGRDGFLIHGAAINPAHYGQESKGCIVVSPVIRQNIHALGLKRLEVVE